MSDTAVKQMTGLFRACLAVVTPIGGPTLALQMLVDPVRHSVSGIGTLTQATNPPLELHFANLRGYFSQHGELNVVYLRTEGSMPGAPVIEIQLVLQGWSEGTGQYTYASGSIPIPPTHIDGKVEKTPC